MAVAWPADDSPSREELRGIAGRGQAIVPSNERLLPVLPALADILPEGGLRRGSGGSGGGAAAPAPAPPGGAAAAGPRGAPGGGSPPAPGAGARGGGAPPRPPPVPA